MGSRLKDDVHIDEKYDEPIPLLHSVQGELGMTPVLRIPIVAETRLTWRLLLAVFSVGFGTWFLIGYGLTYINTPQDVIIAWIREVRCSRLPESLRTPDATSTDVNEADLSEWDPDVQLWCSPITANQTKTMLKDNLYLGAMWALTGSAIVAGSFATVWFIRPLITGIGFKRTLYLCSGVALAAPILCGCCVIWKSYEAFIVGRFVAGFSIGVSSAVANIYIAEISPTKFRGAMGTIPIFLYVTGMLVAAILGLPQIFGNSSSWTVLSWILFVPPLFLLCTLPFLPESPRHLLLTLHDKKQAEAALKWLRGSDNVEAELQVIEQEAQKSDAEATVSALDLLKDPFLRRNLLLCSAAIVGQRFTGYVAIYTYSTNIFFTAGMTRLASLYGTIGLMSVQIVFNGVGLMLMDRAGRRILLIIGNCGCVVACALIVLFSVLYNNGSCEGCQYGALAAVLLFIIVFNLGPGTVPWVFPTEIFAKSARQSAVTLVMASSCLSAALVSAVFPIMLASITDWTFAVFGSITLLFTIFFWFDVTETKGKTFTEIQAELWEKYNKSK